MPFMLSLTVEDNCLRYENGFNASPWTVTRYHGERWEQVGADLLCGIADTFQDVGLVVTGKSTSVTLESLKCVTIHGNHVQIAPQASWVAADSSAKRLKAVYSFSETDGWLFVPDCREAVEDVISWTMWAGPKEEGFRATAFPGYLTFRDRLDSKVWDGTSTALAALVRKQCLDEALFQTSSGPGGWTVYPGFVTLSRLFRLAEPVVARINTELTD